MSTRDNKSVNNKKPNKLLSTQRYLQFAGVHDDTLVLKDGGLRAILEVGAVNFDLKSEQEQNALIMSFQHFLNALDFPVQIMVRSRKLDIDPYIDSLNEKKERQQNDLLKAQMVEHIEFIQRLVESADIMEKRFFVVVPYTPLRSKKKGMIADFLKYITPEDKVLDVIQRKKEFHQLRDKLDVRVNVVQTGLENCGLKVNPLKTEQIIELMYQAYNPEASRYQKLEDVNKIYVQGGPEDNLQEEEIKPEIDLMEG